MAMGVSAQTGPLRPCCPSYSLFSRSCSRPFPSSSTSWSLLASSKALHRQSGCTIQTFKNYQTTSNCWRLVRLSNSTAKMVVYSRDQDNSNGSILKRSIIDPRRVDKEGEQVSRSSNVPPVQAFGGSNPARPCAFVAVDERTELGSSGATFANSWDKETKMLRMTKELQVLKNGSTTAHETNTRANMFSTNVREHVIAPIPHVVPVSASNSTSADVKYGGDRNVAVKYVNGVKLDHSREGLSLAENLRKVSPQSVSALENLEEIKESSSRLKDVNGFELDPSKQVSSKENLRKVAQASVSTSANLEELKETSSGLTNGSVKTSSCIQPDLLERLNSIYDSVLVVDNVTLAREIVKMLTTKYRHLVHACDTEVAKIDVKQETPVDHGEIICFSVYSGPEADFGNGKSCLWVDVLDGGGRDLLKEFASFFEDPSIKKVWHNYSFDNHVIENYGLRLSGFHADTMHMARLWDSSRRTEGGYSLEALTGNKKVMRGAQLCDEQELYGKVSMKTIFGRRKIKKDGSEGKLITISPVEELQREERKPWICYSALDAKSTLKLYESLKSHLSNMPWILDGRPVTGKSMFDFYEEYWRPFGDILVKMETEGMLVDRAYLAEMEKIAKAEQEVAANRFRKWASKYCPDAKYMNVGSDTQLRQLFFGGIANRKDPNEFLPKERIIKIPNVDKVIEEGKKTASKFRSIRLHSILDVPLPADTFTATGWPSVSGDALKTLAGKVSAEYDFMDDVSDEELDDDIENVSENEVTEKQKSTGDFDKSAYGTAFLAFDREEEGREACHAIASLCEVCSIDSLISNFLLPLQGSNISGNNGRIHCSLNINTETGRLSARRPNLQNQPALEKDRYKIRQAFIAAPGNSLIVADYGQLELRILAHLASCKSMLDAFKAGGDFHSRTAMNMYPYIREAVDKKQVLLEWHPQPGEEKPPVPLLKDAFGSERRKAKMLNFSIAYGKTPVGLARDWKVSVKEAKKTVDLWYSDRKEVLTWQEERKEEARDKQFVRTLLGRARRFPSVAHVTNYQKGHIERAAINTPVQGSAADVAMCAMLEISKNARLKELGWKLLLQVHDEVILEGPEETAEVAKAIVVECMAKPFNGKNILQVDLSVDAKCAKNWYAGK